MQDYGFLATAVDVEEDEEGGDGDDEIIRKLTPEVNSCLLKASVNRLVQEEDLLSQLGQTFSF